jgi:hypothetical protein
MLSRSTDETKPKSTDYVRSTAKSTSAVQVASKGAAECDPVKGFETTALLGSGGPPNPRPNGADDG